MHGQPIIRNTRPYGLAQGLSAKLVGWILAAALALSVAACGGGGDSQGSTLAADRADFVIARVGGIVAVRVGETAFLDDNNSSTSSTDPLSFSWSFSYKPYGSNAQLQAATSANPSFVADVRGVYMVQLVVRAGGMSSERAVQLVVVTDPSERPTGPFNHQGLSSTCVNCHNGEVDLIPGVSKIPGKSPDHVSASNSCETCHTTFAFALIPYVDHQEVFGNCSGCHDGVIAVGKSQFHQPTEAECDDCHNTTAFLELEPDGSFDHSGISRACSGCHNGIISIGMTPTVNDTPPGTHPDTTTECGFCHTTDSFLNAYPDHTGPAVVGNRCDSCHGVNAIGEPAGHPVMSVDCASCHSIVSFSMDGVFNHSLLDQTVQSCETCHNDDLNTNFNGLAPGKTPTPPHPNTLSDCGNCHTTENFTTVFAFDHTGVTTDCAQSGCHGDGATGKDANHMPTIEDCSLCHTPGTFTTGTYDHAGVVNNCASCHDNVITVGKLPSHFPTIPATQDCVDCHNTTDFAGATFDHVGINPNDCAMCHNGNYRTTANTLYGKPGTHLPTSQDCSVCHTTTDPFKPALNFNHTGINNNCESCHNGSSVYVATGAIGKKNNHIPALTQCVTCHNNTNAGDFASPNRFLNNVHAGITNGCEGCHVGFFFPGMPNLTKGPDHLPTGQDCDVCHTVAAFAPSTFAHVGISANCASCHDGSPTFVALGARGKTPTPPHPATTQDCAVCHNTTDFADAFVDHNDPAVLAQRCDSCHNGVNATGKDAKPDHVPTIQDCGVCHTAGGAFSPAIFDHTGIVDNCASCHNGIDATGTDAKVNPPHIPITQDCSVCHNPTAFANATFEHQGIVDNCASCHNGNTATGKGNFHVPTGQDCSVCHVTTGFVPGTFDHVGIVDNCSSCHAAGFATPKKVNHVDTSQDCGVCHTTNAFVPATFDHTGIVDNCASCHGVTATPMSPDHIPTALDCHFCHTTATFAGGSWVHDATTVGNCDTCHVNGGGATFKPNGHLTTTEQCDECHTTNRWAPTNFSHDPNGNYPGDHRRDPGCNGCHGNNISSNIPWPWPQYAPDCAACHANDFDSKSDHIGGKNGTVEQNKDCSGGGRGCHKVGDSEFD